MATKKRGENEIAGLLVLIPAADGLLLDNLAIHPRYQGAGLGSALLRFAEERAAAHGTDWIRLYTNVVMAENQRLYTSRGYVETHRATEDGYERVFFAKHLTGQHQATPQQWPSE